MCSIPDTDPSSFLRINTFVFNATGVKNSTDNAQDYALFIIDLTKTQNFLTDLRLNFEEIRLLSAGCSPMMKQVIKVHTEEMGRMFDVMAQRIDRMLNICIRLLTVSTAGKKRKGNKAYQNIQF